MWRNKRLEIVSSKDEDTDDYDDDDYVDFDDDTENNSNHRTFSRLVC